MRYQLASEEFLLRVIDGDIYELDLEKMQIFERVLPKPNEVQRLREAIVSEGYSTFEEAMKVLKFGNVEEFMVKIASIPNIESKVTIIVKILRFI